MTECLDESGAEILIVINGSPFELDKPDKRLNHAVARVKESNLPLIYVNLVGGQDELVFDGGSFVLNDDLQLQVQMPPFDSAHITTKWLKSETHWSCSTKSVEKASQNMDGSLKAVYQAIVLGLRDYVNKNDFSGIIIGLSGGIDSSLSAAVAVDAIGADRVHCVMMPSPYTSKESLEDAAEQASALGIVYDTIPINQAMEAFNKLLEPIFHDRETDATEENLSLIHI